MDLAVVVGPVPAGLRFFGSFVAGQHAIDRVVAALIEAAGASPQPVVFVILGAAGLVTVGMALALQRAGR